MKISLYKLNEIVICPNCRGSIELTESEGTECLSCGELYRRLPYSWELIPSSLKSLELLETWQQLQENGLIAYTEDPENNLSIGERLDCLNFARFCRFDGLVLDVGCGIQPWPSYFASFSERTRFIGVDPLVGESPADYLQIRSVGEFLPFVDQTFDHILFATSLDHVIDPIQSLTEARRISKQNGEIDIWISEKSPCTPKPEISHEWYENLEKPEEAEDVFHFRQLNSNILKLFFDKVGLQIVEEERHRTDEYRRRYFYKVKSID